MALASRILNRGDDGEEDGIEVFERSSIRKNVSEGKCECEENAGVGVKCQSDRPIANGQLGFQPNFSSGSLSVGVSESLTQALLLGLKYP